MLPPTDINRQSLVMMVEAHLFYWCDTHCDKLVFHTRLYVTKAHLEWKVGNIRIIVKNVSNIQWHTHTQYRSSSFKI